MDITFVTFLYQKADYRKQLFVKPEKKIDLRQSLSLSLWLSQSTLLDYGFCQNRHYNHNHAVHLTSFFFATILGNVLTWLSILCANFCTVWYIFFYHVLFYQNLSVVVIQKLKWHMCMRHHTKYWITGSSSTLLHMLVKKILFGTFSLVNYVVLCC